MMGQLTFFFLAIIGAATVDLILDKRKFESDFPWIMIVVGFLAIALIIFIYLAFLLGGDEKHTFGQARGIFWATAIFTLCFCAIETVKDWLPNVVKGRIKINRAISHE